MVSAQILFCTVLGVLLPVPRCASINCNFAVNQIGSPGFSLHAKSDCSSFLLVTSTKTVTPPPSTYYKTTITSFTTKTIVDTVFTTQTTYTSPIVQKRGVVNQVPAYATACKSAQAYSLACSLLGVHPSTTTVTVTAPTPVVTATASTVVTKTTETTTTAIKTDVECKATGLSYGVYDFLSGQPNNAPPENYKSVNPVYIGTTGHMTFDNANYDSGTTNPVMELKGYIKAPTAGPYQFSCSYIDDNIYFWHGPTALGGWTGSNAAFFKNYYDGSPTNIVTVTLAQGQFYPFRYWFSNTGGPWALHFDITAPDGTVLTDDSQGTSSSLVYDPCGAAGTTSFPAFGHET